MSSLTSEDKMNYYTLVRQNIQKFDELVTKIAIEGTAFNVGLLVLSGVFFDQAFYIAAVIICAGSAAITFCLILMTLLYTKLLEISVEIAKELEDEILPESWSSNGKEYGKKLTRGLDEFGKICGKKVAGKHTWKVMLSIFLPLLFFSGILMILYLSRIIVLNIN